MAAPYQKLRGGLVVSFAGERMQLLLGPDHVLAVRTEAGAFAERYYMLNYRDITTVTVCHRKGPRGGIIILGIFFVLVGLAVGALISTASAIAGLIVGSIIFVPGVIVTIRGAAVQWASLAVATAVHRIDLPGLLPLRRALAIQSRIAERVAQAQPAPPPAGPAQPASAPAVEPAPPVAG